MVKIRLTRIGTHKRPFYRIIVADSKSRRDGPFIEIIGTYDPLLQADRVKVDLVKAQYWIGNGAQLTPTVKRLLTNAGLGAA